MGIHYLSLSWKHYHDLCQKLAAGILSKKAPIDQIVAISRGGLTLGHLLTDLLQIPIATITIQSYSDIQTSGEARLTAKLNSPIRGKHILLVDDVSDSGKTLKRAVRYLHRAGAATVTTVTMFYKPHSTFRPDYYAKQTTKWILFPYEPTEMIMLISRKLEKEGKSKAAIQSFLKQLSFTDDQIVFVRKYYLSS